MSFVLLGILNSQAAGGVSAGSYDLLETQIVSGSASSLTFSSLSSSYGSTYKHLQLRISFQDNDANYMFARINGNSASDKYMSHRLYANGTSYISNSTEPGNAIQTSKMYLQRGQSNGQANTFTSVIIDFTDPFHTSKKTVARYLGYGKSTWLMLGSAMFDDTAAVDSIQILSNLQDKSRISLYGWKAQ